MNDNYLIAGCDHSTSYFGTVTGGFYPFQVSGAQRIWSYGVNNAAQIVGTCKCDFDADGDTDGSDVAEFISDPPGGDLGDLADDLGRTNCPHHEQLNKLEANS